MCLNFHVHLPTHAMIENSLKACICNAHLSKAVFDSM